MHVLLHVSCYRQYSLYYLWSCLVQIKKASAQGEDAWKEAGTKEGVQVWRIVKFKVRNYWWLSFAIECLRECIKKFT